VTAITQLIQQVTYWQQQLQGMNAQLGQLQQTHASMIGNRHMQDVLPMTYEQRNYLPPDPAGLTAIGTGSAPGYAGLSAQVQAVMAANAVLTPQQLV
jgi:type IV secretion system protein VirB5